MKIKDKSNIRYAAAWLLAALAAGGCITAPNVVLLDHKTALEQQAAGELHPLENRLLQEGIQPKAEDIPGEKLEKAGAGSGEGTLGEVARLYSAVQSDADLIDSMLSARCLGEGTDGLLQPTPDACRREVDTAELARVVGRENMHRRQIWKVIARQKPGASADEIRDKWRRVHLQRVVCGGWIETAEGKWEAKPCGD